jgi:hypothetical protein
MDKAANTKAPVCRAHAAEVAWMAVALQTAQASESRFRALAGMIRDGWPDARIIALAERLYPGQHYMDRCAAMTVIDGLHRQPHSRLLLELLLADAPQADLPSVASPFRAS